MLQPLSGDSTPNEEAGKTADPTEVASKSFPTSLRGYDQEEVRVYLRHIASALRDAQRREADMRSRLGKAVRRAEEASAKADSLSDTELTNRLGDEVTRIIESARVAAEERTARSVNEAEALLDQARSEAQSIREDAEAMLGERTAEAEAEAAKIMAEADSARAEREREGDELYGEAQQIARDHLEQAVREGDSIVEQAEVARRQILKDMDRRRRQMRMQVEQLKAARDRLLASHGEMSRVLDEISVELRQSVVEAKTKGDSAVRRISESRFATHHEIEAEIADAAMIGRLDLPPIELRDELDIDAVVGASLDSEDVSLATDLEIDDDVLGASIDTIDSDDAAALAATSEETTSMAPRDAAAETALGEDLEIEAVEIDDLVPEEGVLDSDDGFFIATVTAEHQVVSLIPRADDEDDYYDDDYDYDDDDDLSDDDLLAEVSPLFPAEAPPSDTDTPLDRAEPNTAPETPLDDAEPETPLDAAEPETPLDAAEPDTAAETTEELVAEEVIVDEGPDPDDEVSAAIEAVLADFPEVSDAARLSHPSEGSRMRAGAEIPAGEAQSGEAAETTVTLDGGNDLDHAEAMPLDADDPASDDSLATIFARIRVRNSEAPTLEEPEIAQVATTESAPASETAREVEPGADVESAGDENVSEVEPAAEVEPVRDDAAVIAMRDEAIGDLVDKIGRRLKRVLMDEQNVVFEAAEREYGGPLIEIMPDKEHHVDLYLDAVFLQLQATYGAGAAFVDPHAKVRKLPRSFFEQTLADLVVTPLREALAQAVPVDAGEETSQTLRRFYRSHKNNAINIAAQQLASLAFNKGTAQACGHGAPVRWIHVAGDGDCPDGERNAAARGVTVGDEFPSGHLAPPIGVGCRCILVPADR